MKIEILLVEDNPGDAYLLKYTFNKTGASININIVEDGVEALDYLYQRGTHANAARPDLILLDLNLPRKGGLEVLKEISNDERLPRVPVVVLSMSRDEEDIRQSYRFRASSFIPKPLDLEDFEQVVKLLDQYWLGPVVLPPRN